MTTKEQIIKYIQAHAETRSSDLAKRLGIGRQTIAHHLKSLVETGVISKSGSTRNATYSYQRRPRPPQLPTCHFLKNIKGLEEHLVYEEIQRRLQLKNHLSKNVESIAFYAFGEMLNNAIDHSRSEKVEIVASIERGRFEFSIRDRGVGAFANIKKKFQLNDEWEAAEHLLKGKQTTDPERHSGQGIFFTSRVADRFSLVSHKIELVFDADKDDIALKEARNLTGTEVHFSIRARSKRKLKDIFDRYADEEYKFNQGEINFGVFKDRELLSRSQARRILAGLEEFERIVFDFKDVAGIGQAFADEIFRVYAKRFPNKILEPINQNQAVHLMIQRARGSALPVTRRRKRP